MGLSMLMSAAPCKAHPAACNGAEMAADHISTISSHLDGDYTLIHRAPRRVGSEYECDNGVYAYFTAGYTSRDGKWNEMNFGFHPDRDHNGTAVSCEHHDDTGGYHEAVEGLGASYRATFNTFVIRLRKGSLTWLVGYGDGPLEKVHHAEAKLTEPMTTRLILRTNWRNGDPGSMADHVWEVGHFSFVPVA